MVSFPPTWVYLRVCGGTDMACAQSANVSFIHAEDWRERMYEEVL